MRDFFMVIGFLIGVIIFALGLLTAIVIPISIYASDDDKIPLSQGCYEREFGVILTFGELYD